MGRLQGQGPVTRQVLDTARCNGQCGHTDCDGSVVMRATCHHAPSHLDYNPNTGTMTARCSVCLVPFVSILVAGSVPS